MLSAVLDSMKEQAAKIAITYTDGRMDAIYRGTSKIEKISNDSMRVIYLWGIMNYAYIDGTTVYLGDTAVTDAYIQEAMDKLWHYNGRFSQVDLSDYAAIVADDGEGGAYDPSTTTQDNDHYRSGNIPVTVGANPVTFIKNGVASALPSNDYTVEAYAISQSGYRQNNVVVSGIVAGGFVASDILEAGTLYYIATLNT